MPRVQEHENGFELDAVGQCYFAALIEGLRIVAEKEEDLGVVPGSTPIDADALVVFVRDKGDALVHHMNTEAIAKIKWSEAELQSVLTEARKLSGGAELKAAHLDAAQKSVLPKDRQRPFNSLYCALDQLRRREGIQRAPRRQLSSPSRNGQHRNGSVVATAAPPVAKLAAADPGDSLVELLANQITTTLVAIQVKALERAADQLRRAR